MLDAWTPARMLISLFAFATCGLALKNTRNAPEVDAREIDTVSWKLEGEEDDVNPFDALLPGAEESDAEDVDQDKSRPSHYRLRVTYPHQEAPLDGEGVHVAYVACGRGVCLQAMDAISSFLVQAKLEQRVGVKHTVHMFVDEACYDKLSNFLSSPRNAKLVDAATVLLYLMRDVNALATKALYKECSSVRLSLPELLPDLSKVLYLDTDTLVVGPIKEVYDLQPKMWGMAENDPTWYVSERCPPRWRDFVPETLGKNCWSPRYVHGLNSGVWLLNMDAWRQQGMDKEMKFWVEVTTNDTAVRAPLMGDQDLLNILALLHDQDDYTLLLPCNANSVHLNRKRCYYSNHSNDWSEYDNAVAAEDTKIASEIGLPPPTRSQRAIDVTLDDTASPPTLASDATIKPVLHRYMATDSDQWVEVALPGIPSNSWHRNERKPIVLHSKFHMNMEGKDVWHALQNRILEGIKKVSAGEALDGSFSNVCDVIGGCSLE